MTEKVSAEQARDTWNSIRFIVGLYQDHPDAVRLDRYFAQAAAAPPPVPVGYVGAMTLCPECGPGVDVDEDGLCVTCGATASGPWAERACAALRNAAAAPPLPADVEAALDAMIADLRQDATLLQESGRWVSVRESDLRRVLRAALSSRPTPEQVKAAWDAVAHFDEGFVFCACGHDFEVHSISSCTFPPRPNAEGDEPVLPCEFEGCGCLDFEASMDVPLNAIRAALPPLPDAGEKESDGAA